MNSADIELAVANYFDFRRNLIVPNISWGLRLHECDLLVLTPSGYAYEVEIKISKGDLKADAKKGHGHESKRISKLYFAIPAGLKDCVGLIPSRAGVLVVSDGGYVERIRDAEKVNDYQFSDEEKLNLARLGTLRTWALRSTIRQWVKEKEYQRQHSYDYDLPLYS